MKKLDLSPLVAALTVTLLAGLPAGCAHKWEDLKKPASQRSFVLDKDHTRTEKRGIGVQWVEGLRAGVYTLSAEDDDGVYFAVKQVCVIKLSGDNGDEYLKTGQTKIQPLPGGLWLPKPGVAKAPKLFYIFGGQSSAPSGALVDAIVASGKGDVLFIDYESEKDFVKGLAISEQ